MDKLIEIKNLNKSFGDLHAVNDLSFCVKEGELFAFLGVNGAGKSTTITIMCGQLQKDSGMVVIDGFDTDKQSDKIKNILGVVYQNSVLDKALTVKDNLECRAALYGITGERFITRLKEIDLLLGITDIINRPIGKLSGGQRRRADIARALLHKPKILILDEPTTGLDPQTRKSVWEAVDKLRKKEGITVFLTTHYMEEAAEADYVVIIDAGRIAAEGTPLQLKNTYTGDFITLYNPTKEDIEKIHLPYTTLRDAIKISVKDTKEATNLILKHPNVFRDYEITKGKMDDVFIAVTGKKLEGGNN